MSYTGKYALVLVLVLVLVLKRILQLYEREREREERVWELFSVFNCQRYKKERGI